MKSRREMVEIFGRCSRELNKVALNAKDGFFSRLCAEKSDKLLSEFIFFLKEWGNKNTQHDTRVAQCGLGLIFQIKSTLNLLEILKHLGLAKPPTSLLLEKNLLLLELSVFDTLQPEPVLSGKAREPILPKPRKKPRPGPLGQTHKVIAEFIKARGQVQNTEIFGQFGRISRRTLKRKLSDLIRANSIKRITNGKKVSYAALAEGQI